MMCRIRIRNFKCFEDLDVPTTGLNLLCGLNGMGKSSFIQAMLVLRQSFTSGELERGRLVLGGGLADLGTGQDVLFEDAAEDVVRFTLDGNDGRRPCSLSFDYSRTAEELRIQRDASATQSRSMMLDEWKGTPPLGGNLIYVSAERLGPRKLYTHSEVHARGGDLGTRGEYAVNYLQASQDELLSASDPRCPPGLPSRRLIEIIDYWLQKVTPGAHLQLETIKSADAIIAGFSFERPNDVRTRVYRAMNVGFGLSYTLPVLTALLAPRGSLCIVENPEAHLHPRGQTKLAELAVRASLAGVQIVIETHSDHFMDGVRIAVRDGLISPQQTAFHYFERQNGKTVVTSPSLDANGRLSTWPDGFFDQHEENLARLIAPKS